MAKQGDRGKTIYCAIPLHHTTGGGVEEVSIPKNSTDQCTIPE